MIGRTLLMISALVMVPTFSSPASAQNDDDEWAECFFGCTSTGYHTADFCTAECNRRYDGGDQTGGGDPDVFPLPPGCAPDCRPK